MLYVWADQQAGQSTEWSVPFLGLESFDLLWFLKIILLLPPLFLDQTTAARRAQKNYETAPHPYLRVCMTPPPPLSKGLDPSLLTYLWKSFMLTGHFAVGKNQRRG